jgi:RNA polymerase sigma factor (sigma-70 family)
MQPAKLRIAVHQAFAIAEQNAPEGRTDGQLLRDFAARRDQTAFEVLVRRHGPMVLGVCRRVLRHFHDAEDAFQGTFVVLARKATALGQREIVGNWLYGVAYRTALKARATAAARLAKERKMAKPKTTAIASDHEELALLDRELNLLPVAHRAVIVLCDLEGKTYKEAAKQLGCAEGTVGSRLTRARQLLAKRLTDRGATLGVIGLPGAIPQLAPAPVPAALLTATVQAATGTASVPALALANGVLKGLLLAKLKTVGAVLVGLSVFGLALGVLHRTLAGQGADTPVQFQTDQNANGFVDDPRPLLAKVDQAKAPAPGRDLFNDPLPKGAMARLGTVEFRHGSASTYTTVFAGASPPRSPWGFGLASGQAPLIFTPDGKNLVSVGGGWIRRWNIATGQATANTGEGWLGAFDAITLASADGKLACIYRDAVLREGEGRVLNESMIGPGYVKKNLTWEGTEYDLETGKIGRKFRLDFPRDNAGQRIHGNWISADGKTCAALSADNEITVWSTVAGSTLYQLRPLQNDTLFTTMAVTKDEKTLIVGDDGNTLHLHDLASGKKLRSFGFADRRGVANMAVSPNGQWLLTIGSDGAFVRLWDIEKGTEERRLDFPEAGKIETLLFTPDNRTVVAGIRRAENGIKPLAIRTWNALSGNPGRAWTADPALGLGIAVNPDGKMLATMNGAGVIRFWDMETGHEQRAVDASPCGLASVSFQADGMTLLTIGEDYAVRHWDAANGRLLGNPSQLPEGRSPVFFARDKLAMSGLVESDRLQIFDTVTGKRLLTCQGTEKVFTPDGKRMATSMDGLIQVYDVTTSKLIHSWKASRSLAADNNSPPVVRGLTPDGLSLILQGDAVAVCDIETGEVKSSWSLNGRQVLDGKNVPLDAFVPPKKQSGKGAPKKGGLAPMKGATGEMPRRQDRVNTAVVSTDGSRIAFIVYKPLPLPPGAGPTSYGFYRLMVLETATGKLLHQSDLDDNYGSPSLAFSPDGKLVGLGGWRTTRVWEVGKETPIRVLEGQLNYIKSIAFSPDGNRLATASSDSTVLIWDLKR